MTKTQNDTACATHNSTTDESWVLDKIDKDFPTLDPESKIYMMSLGKICSSILQLPTSAVLSGLEKNYPYPIDVSEAHAPTWQGNLGGDLVAVKELNIYPEEKLDEVKKILWKRVPVWMKLSHPNILPFRGVDMTLFPLSLVYDWGKNCDIVQYTFSHTDVLRSSLLLDVAKGLKYLHDLNIPHGCLKGPNVIIDQEGRARLTGYGLEPIFSDPNLCITVAPRAPEAKIRWLAPEILKPANPVRESKEADVFAFGLVAINVFTTSGPVVPSVPFGDEEVADCISKGTRPRRPNRAQAPGLTDEIWVLLEACWHLDPNQRPTIDYIVEKWEEFVEDAMMEDACEWGLTEEATMSDVGPQPPLTTGGITPECSCHLPLH